MAAQKAQIPREAAAAAAASSHRPHASATPAAPLTPGNAAQKPAFSGRSDPRQLIVIGSSTGGIEALRTVLPQLPEGLPPIAIVQHISAYFSKVVAERLNAICPFTVCEAEDGMLIQRGTTT